MHVTACSMIIFVAVLSRARHIWCESNQGGPVQTNGNTILEHFSPKTERGWNATSMPSVFRKITHFVKFEIGELIQIWNARAV